MTKIALDATYYAGTLTIIDLPEGVVWADIKDWYVKWDCFHFKLEGKEWQEISMNSECNSEIIDWKRPKTVTVYAADEDGEPEWDNELAEG